MLNNSKCKDASLLYIIYNIFVRCVNEIPYRCNKVIYFDPKSLFIGKLKMKDKKRFCMTFSSTTTKKRNCFFPKRVRGWKMSRMTFSDEYDDEESRHLRFCIIKCQSSFFWRFKITAMILMNTLMIWNANDCQVLKWKSQHFHLNKHIFSPACGVF